MNNKHRGSAYERKICLALSLWWSGGLREDLFWRTAGSGARATSKARKGKKIAVHNGDITSTDGEGTGLIDLVTIEVKRGYNKVTIGDILDKPKKAAAQQFEKWVMQAEEGRANAGCPYWWIIHSRTRRDDLLYMPSSMFVKLVEVGAFGEVFYPIATLVFSFGGNRHEITAMKLKSFFKRVESIHIHRLAK